MKSLIFTTVTILTISLMTLTDFNNEKKLLSSNESVDTNLTSYALDLSQVFTPVDHKTVNIEDLNVIEIEEEVTINFDVKKYLPKDFYPYLNIDNSIQ